jgi:hypothetical protein
MAAALAISKSFAKISALRMRLEIQQCDEAIGFAAHSLSLIRLTLSPLLTRCHSFA